MIKKLLLAGSSLIAMCVPAMADPVTIGGFLFTNTFLGGVAGLGTLITATQIGILGLGLAAQALLGRPRGQRVDPGEFKSVFETSDSSEVNAIGRCSVAGLKAFGNTAGADRHRLILHCASKLVAVEEYFLGERPVTVEASGLVSSPPYSKPGDSWVTWEISGDADGTETAWPTLTSAYDFWTSAHRVRGIAQSLLTYTSPGITTAKFNKLFQSGVPDPRITGRFNIAYDPRESGADLNNTATWVWSQNGPLCAARIMMSYPDLTGDDFDWDFISDEADKADTLVDTLTGTEPRSRLSGIWLSESKRGETMDDVLRSIGAEITLSDTGLIRIRLIDDSPTSEIAFTEKHIASFSLKSGPEGVERPNVCRVRYYSSERNYELADIDLTGIPWARVDDEVTRYGEKILDIELPFCPSASQAQRIARRLFLLERADAGVITTNMAGMAAWGLYYGTIVFPDLDENPTCQLAAPRADDASGEVEIPFKAWPQELIDDAYDPATMEAAAPDAIPDLSFVSDLDTPAAPSAAALVQYADNSYELRTQFAGVTSGTQAEAVYRTYTGGLPDPFTGMTEYQAVGNWYAYAAADVTGDDVDFKCRFFDADDEGSYFSDLLALENVQIDNTAPVAPVINVTVVGESSPFTFNFSVTCSSVNVASIVISGGGSLITVDEEIRPGEPVEATSGPIFAAASDTNILVTAIAYTSNGTAGPSSTYNIYIPGTG